MSTTASTSPTRSATTTTADVLDAFLQSVGRGRSSDLEAAPLVLGLSWFDAGVVTFQLGRV